MSGISAQSVPWIIRRCAGILLLVSLVCHCAALAAHAEERLLDLARIASAQAEHDTKLELEHPLLVADAGRALRRMPDTAGDFDVWFSQATVSSHTTNLSLPHFNELATLRLPSNRLHVELMPEDFKELDEYRPKLTTASLDANDQRSVVGGRLLLTTPFEERGKLQTEARLLWLSEFLQAPGANATAFFAPGDSLIFATQGLTYGSNWAMLGGRMQIQLISGLSAFAGYDAQVNSQQMFHIGSTGLRYAW